MHVDPVRLQAQQLLVDQVHHTEGLVDLPVVHIRLLQARTLQRLGGGSSRGCGRQGKVAGYWGELVGMTADSSKCIVILRQGGGIARPTSALLVCV